MSSLKKVNYEPWPELPFAEFSSTAHLLHMATQAIGKLKLLTPFEPHWANVPLWVTARGLTTGLIPYDQAAFSVDVDLIDHKIICNTTWGHTSGFGLSTMSVAELTAIFFELLASLGIDVIVNPKPQEVPDPILFDQDTETRHYDARLANAWWRILVSTHRVLKRYHAHFDGETPPIGFMWGTFDIRDARYNGKKVPTTGAMSGYLRRNAMDEAQVEVGWWHGNPTYPRPAFYSFTYPQPEGIETAKVKPAAAKWEKSLGEFVLDYDDLRKAKDPDADLYAFFESTYRAGAERAGWDAKFLVPGKPV